MGPIWSVVPTRIYVVRVCEKNIWRRPRTIVTGEGCHAHRYKRLKGLVCCDIALLAWPTRPAGKARPTGSWILLPTRPSDVRNRLVILCHFHCQPVWTLYNLLSPLYLSSSSDSSSWARTSSTSAGPKPRTSGTRPRWCRSRAWLSRRAQPTTSTRRTRRQKGQSPLHLLALASCCFTGARVWKRGKLVKGLSVLE